jgi:putative inorganic carbon (hco3(-)) transporter
MCCGGSVIIAASAFSDQTVPCMISPSNGPRSSLSKLPPSSRLTLSIVALLAVLLGVTAGGVSAYLANPLYAFVALAGILVFAAAMVSLEFGLLLLIFLTYTRFSDVIVHVHSAPSVAKALIAVLALAILLRWAIFGERPTSLGLPALLLAIYGLVGLASMLFAVDRSVVLQSLGDYWKDAAVVLIIIALLRRPHQFRHAVWVLLIVGIFLGALSLHQFLTKNYHSQYGGFAVALYMNISTGANDYRLAGPVGDPNFFAQVMLVPGLLGLERLLHERKPILKGLAGLSALLSILTVIFTYSRGALVALVVALILYFVLYPPRPAQLLLAAALGIVVLAFIPPSYYSRALTLQNLLPTQHGFSNIRQDAALQGRISENLTAILMFEQHPIFGVGLRNFPILYQDYTQSLGLAPSGQTRSPHNLYLEVAVESGIVGLIVFLWIVGLAYQSLWLARRNFLKAGLNDHANTVTGFSIAFAAYMTAALFVHGAYPRFFYILIGLAFALRAFSSVSKDTDQQRAAGQQLYGAA